MNFFRLVSVLGLAALALSCSSLPKPAAPDSRLVAVVFDRGESKTAYFKQVTFFVTTSVDAKPVELKPGVNFLNVPTGETRLKLLTFGAAGTVTFVPTPMFESRVDATIEVPEEPSVVLWPVFLTYHGKMKNGLFRPEATLDPMPDKTVKNLIDSWQHDGNAAAWQKILVGAP